MLTISPYLRKRRRHREVNKKLLDEEKKRTRGRVCRYVLREDADEVTFSQLVWKSSCRKHSKVLHRTNV